MCGAEFERIVAWNCWRVMVGTERGREGGREGGKEGMRERRR